MKLVILPFIFFAPFSIISAVENTGGGESSLSVTELASPPYEIGDLIPESGYYIDQAEGAAQLNLRIQENRFRLYWIDGNGLVVEPEFKQANVRLIGSVNGRSFHYLETLPSGAGLGSPLILRPPFIYNVNLVLIPEAANEATTVHSFRYTPDLNVEKAPSSAETP